MLDFFRILVFLIVDVVFLLLYHFIIIIIIIIINPKRRKPKKVTQRHKGLIGPLPSTFNTIHPIELIFSTYNELP